MGIEIMLTFTRDITRLPENHPGAGKPIIPGCAGNRVPDSWRWSSVP